MALADSLPFRGDAPRILIVRLSALGDIVFATSLLAGLRAAWPQAHIAWLVQSGFAGILENDARVDQLIRVPAGALGSPAALWQLRRELARHDFDWVIDAQGLAKSRLLAALAPGATRIGFKSKEPLAFLIRHAVAKNGDGRDIASEYRFLAQQISGKPAAPPSLVIADEDRIRAIRDLAACDLQPGFIALCPFTTRPQKHWMEDYWPQLAVLLTASPGRAIAIFGGPGDVEAAARIAAASTVPMVNLAGKTRLNQLAAWLQQAGVVIGVDTGLTHIGVAVQRPVVALFGSTCPYLQGAASPLTVLYDALACSPCRRHPTCEGRFDCLRGLTPPRVAAAARALLAHGVDERP